jgi:hypothetical protein
VAGQEQWVKERVWVGSLLCGPNKIVLAVANHLPAAKPGHPDIEPATDFTVQVALPDFLPAVDAYEATEAGLAPYPCHAENARLFLHVNSVRSGRVFVLKRTVPD